jgi:predicted Rossmann fold flavoprotein
MTKKIGIVGAGAAGMMAAGTAAKSADISGESVEVLLFEKNKSPGKKLLITGKGRCNLTSSVDIEDMISNTPGNGNFLYSAFYNFSNTNITKFFNTHGVETKTERGSRVFPVNGNSEEILNALLRYLNENNVRLITDSPVKSIEASEGKIKSIILRNGTVHNFDSVIIATGGMSYPLTGSTGDGYKMASEVGHKIISLRPSLVPLVVKEKWVSKLKGLTLKNVSVKLFDINGQKIFDDFGELLFTHFGLSGPIILTASRHISGYNYNGIKAVIDLKPALNYEKLERRVIRDFDKYSKKQLKNSLGDLLPKALIPIMINCTGISPNKFVNQIRKEERQKLVYILKNLELNIKGTRPIQEAIVTAGGISVNEINPSTMESKLIKGLFFAGEIIDVDAYTGGFNLTIAFSTGHLAGENCWK